MNSIAPASATRGKLVINVELDDRSFLFPDGKTLSHISIQEDHDDLVRLDGIFHFNESRLDPAICSLPVEDARELARSIIDAVYQGRTQHLLSAHAKVAIIFNPNGFVMKFGEERALRELFLNSPAIIRVAQGLLRIVDRMSALPQH